jgi:hypothetical protein
MQKTDVNTVLALIFLPTAVVVIGGLVLMPAIQQQEAQAESPDKLIQYCFTASNRFEPGAVGHGAFTSCQATLENCQLDAQILGVNPNQCHKSTFVIND